ncbi:MAG: hypothetical protein HY721_05145 [Planctomycetes bacterium]|nr:hypothetical protein [Planctomycetota bacterium]
MRAVARYVFSTEDRNVSVDTVLDVVKAWIASKGELSEPDVDGTRRIGYGDGRIARLVVEEGASISGRFATWSLEEPTTDGQFRTRIGVAGSAGEVIVSVLLEAGSALNVLAPVHFDVHCPRVVRDVLALSGEWRVGGTSVVPYPLDFRGRSRGEALSALIQEIKRTLPLIVVSEHEGLILHPGLTEDLAKDLMGLSLVAQADREASLQVTRTLGREWCCFNGAIRVYWPRSYAPENPFAHPLWTATRLLWGGVTTEEASKRFRHRCRRELMARSCFGIKPSPVFERIRNEEHKEAIEAKRKAAKDRSDWEQIADEYCRENEKLLSRIEELEERCKRLETDNENLRLRLDHATRKPTSPEAEPQPEEEAQPETVAEAVERSRERFAELLVFGDDVSRGLETIQPDAGPPDKVEHYLQVLARLAAARRQGALGTTQLKWLEGQGVVSSAESETVRNSKKEQRKRTWHDGRGQREFDHHLKPADATSPDRCVRIYFHWDEESRRVIVGWVGGHP